MADDAFPFVLAGTAESWDPAVRVLYVGSTRLEVAPGMAVEALVPKHDGGRWVVTKIEARRPGF